MKTLKSIKTPIAPSLAGMVGWVFIMTIIMGVVFSAPKQKKVVTQSLTDDILSGIVVVELSHAARAAGNGTIDDKSQNISSRIVLDKDGLFDPIIFQAANRYHVEPALVKAVIMAESGYNSKAVSDKGAKGLMQLMPATAEMLGVEDYYHPEDNINAGAKYLKYLLDKFDGDVELAVAAYNAGYGRVKEYNGVPPYKETQDYIKKVLEYYELYKKQMSST